MTSLLMNVCRKTCQVTPSSFAGVTASSNHERGLTSECKRPRAGFAFRIESTLFTTKDVGKGVGLGLSLSRTIIEERGKLELSEKAGHPSFSFSLPWPKRSRRYALERFLHSFGRRRACIVDVLCEWLQRVAGHVYGAADGMQAV